MQRAQLSSYTTQLCFTLQNGVCKVQLWFSFSELFSFTFLKYWSICSARVHSYTWVSESAYMFRHFHTIPSRTRQIKWSDLNNKKNHSCIFCRAILKEQFSHTHPDMLPNLYDFLSWLIQVELLKNWLFLYVILPHSLDLDGKKHAELCSVGESKSYLFEMSNWWWNLWTFPLRLYFRLRFQMHFTH